MKLSAIHETAGQERVKRALQTIYGRHGQPVGQSRSRLYQATNDAGYDAGNQTAGARSYDPGVPWKLKYRKFFRIGSDGQAGTIKY